MRCLEITFTAVSIAHLHSLFTAIPLESLVLFKFVWSPLQRSRPVPHLTCLAVITAAISMGRLIDWTKELPVMPSLRVLVMDTAFLPSATKEDPKAMELVTQTIKKFMSQKRSTFVEFLS